MSGTTAEDVVDCLNNQRFDDLPERLADFLKDANTTDKMEATQKSAMKILHLMTLRMDQAPVSVLPNFLSSMTEVHAFLANDAAMADIMLRDVLLKLIKKKLFGVLLPFARCLSSSLQPEASKLSLSCYAALWNAVIKASKDLDPTLTLNIRLSALAFLLQGQPFAKFADKLRISLQIYADGALKNHREETLEELTLFMEEIVGAYFDKNQEFTELYVSLVLSYLKVVATDNLKSVVLATCRRDTGQFAAIFTSLVSIASDHERVDLTAMEELAKNSSSIVRDFCSVALRLTRDWRIVFHIDLMNIQSVRPSSGGEEKTVNQYLSSILLRLDGSLNCLKAQNGELSADDISMLVNNAVDLISKYERAIEGHQKHADLTLKIANISYKLGRWAYQQKLSAEAVPLFKVATLAFFKIAGCKRGAVASTNAEKSFEALIDCLRRTGCFQEALATVVDCLHGNEKLLMSRVKTWVQLKMKSADDPSLRRSLAECYFEKYPKTILTQEQVLSAELDAFNTTGRASVSMVLPLLDALLSLPSIRPTLKASLLTEKAQRILTTDKHKAEDLLKESLKIIKQETKKVSKKGQKGWPTREDDSALAHFWMYTAQHSSSHKMSADFLGPLHDDSAKDLDSFEDCVTLTAESVAMATLDIALELWEGWQSIASFRCVSRSLETIATLASIYAVSGESLKMCRALTVVNAIATATGYHDVSLQCTGDLVRAMLSLNQPQVAMKMAEAQSKQLTLVDGDFCKRSFHVAAVLMAKAEAHLMLREAGSEEAALGIARSLTAFRASVESHGRTKEALLFESQYQLMMYQVHLQTANQHCSLDHMTSGMRCLFKVIVHLMSDNSEEDDVGACSLMHWSSVHALLSTLLSVGDAFLLVGDAQMTRSCFVRGICVAQALGLSRRLAEFHVKLAELDLLSNRIGSSCAHLRRSEFILTSDHSETSSVAHEEGGEEEEEDFLVGAFPSDHGDEAKAMDEKIITSPLILRKRGLEIVFPEHWKEEKSTEKHCLDLTTQRLLVQLFALRIEVKQKERPVAMEAEVKVIVARTQKVNKSLQANKHFQSHVAQARDCFQSELLSLAVQQTFVALETNDHGSYKAWLKMAMTQETADSGGGHLHAAQMRYLRAVTHVKWPPQQQDVSQVDEIAAKIGLMSVNSAMVFETPCCVKRKLRTVRGQLKPQLQPLSEGENIPIEKPKKEARKRKVRKVTETRKAAILSTVFDLISSDDGAEAPPRGKRRTTLRKARKRSTEAARSADSDVAPPPLPVARQQAKKVVPEQRDSSGPDLDPYPLLQEAFQLLRHHPTVPVFRLTCHALALLNLPQGAIHTSDWQTAFLLAESQATTFRHSCVLKLSKQLKLKNPSEHMQRMHDQLAFAQGAEHLRQQVRCLPPEWTVVQVTIVQAVGQGHHHMLVTRFVGDDDPLTVLLPHFSSNRGQAMLTEFHEIVAQNNRTLQLTDKHEWWTRREKLDDRMKNLLADMQSVWLGSWGHGLFLGKPCSEDDALRLRTSVEAVCDVVPALDRVIVEALCNTAHSLTDVEIISVLSQSLSASVEGSLLSSCLGLLRGHVEGSPERSPVMLVLDNGVQHLPWENLPALRSHATFFRSPSLHFLCAHYQLCASSNDAFKKGIDLQSTFYVLDPQSNLPNTREKFLPLFRKQAGWQGLVGEVPQHTALAEATSQHDLFLYLGHGSGSKFIQQRHACGEDWGCRAVALLIGCSSGRLTAEGCLDATGVMLSYLMAGCPCVMGNLWDVTDRDIDRFFEQLMLTWQLQPQEGSCTTQQLFAGLQSSREACKLQQLIGAAPVVYGLPMCLQRPLT